jgi:hypothetical protein
MLPLHRTFTLSAFTIVLAFPLLAHAEDVPATEPAAAKPAPTEPAAAETAATDAPTSVDEVGTGGGEAAPPKDEPKLREKLNFRGGRLVLHQVELPIQAAERARERLALVHERRDARKGDGAQKQPNPEAPNSGAEYPRNDRAEAAAARREVRIERKGMAVALRDASRDRRLAARDRREAIRERRSIADEQRALAEDRKAAAAEKRAAAEEHKDRAGAGGKDD